MNALRVTGLAACLSLTMACGGDKSLEGRVHGTAVLVGGGDPSGIEAVVDGVDRKALSAGSGEFEIPDVPLGVYTLTLRKGLFEETIPDVLVLPGHDPMHIGATLQPLHNLELQRGQRLMRGARSTYGLRASEDGSRFFFLSKEEDGTVSLHWATAAERKPMQLSVDLASTSGMYGGGEPYYLIAPDGRHIVALETNEAEEGSDTRFVIVAVDTDTTTALPASAVPGRFSPDGRFLLFTLPSATAGAPPRQWIASLGAEPVVFRELGGAPNSGYGSNVLAPSASGFRLLSWVADGLDVLDVEKEEHHLIAGLQPIRAEALSPDGEHLLARNASGATVIVRLETRELQILSTGTVLSTAFSPQAERLAFIEAASGGYYDPMGMMKVFELSDGSTTVALERVWASQLQFADGKHIVFLGSTGDRAPEIQVVSLGGGGATRRSLGTAGGYWLSADRTRIAISSSGSYGGSYYSQHRLSVASIADGSAVEIATDLASGSIPAFSPSGLRVVYQSAEVAEGGSSVRLGIKSAAVDGSASVVLARQSRGSGYSPYSPSVAMPSFVSFSPSGEHALLFAPLKSGPSAGALGAQLVPLAGGEPIVLASNVARAAWLGKTHLAIAREPGSTGFDFQRAIYVSEVP